MRILARLLLVLLCASGPPRCVETESTLADPETAEADEKLIGQWIGLLPGGSVLIFPEDSKRPGILRIVYAQIRESRDKDPVAFVTFRAWRTSLGGRAYLNVEKIAEHPPGEFADLQRRTIVRYEHVEDASTRYRFQGEEYSGHGMLRFLYLDADKIATAIGSGKIAGRVEGAGDERRVTITAAREALRAFLAAQGSDDFFKRKSGSESEDNALLLLRAPSTK